MPQTYGEKLPRMRAFFGRVSNEDNEDPTVSLPRQFANSETVAAETGERVIALFYDVESRAMRLAGAWLGERVGRLWHTDTARR
jgi:hypothetical protein